MDQMTLLMAVRRCAGPCLALFWVSCCCLAGGAEAAYCVACHAAADGAHGDVEIACSACHGGDKRTAMLPQAHAGLIEVPGELANAARSCGNCHAAEVAGVAAGDMHTGAGMVATTRALLDSDDKNRVGNAEPRLDALGDSVADSLLRRLCASCHLGQPRSGEAGDHLGARGGGCLACHLQERAGPGHPRVGLPVADSACVGCHSRSGRVALNYAGLAEVADPVAGAAGQHPLARLSDGRLVERRPADVHHRAGLGCVDCHTGAGLMGLVQTPDIACVDCHDNRLPRLRRDAWPERHRGLLRRVPFAATPEQPFLQTRQGTPLVHLELRGAALWLHPKSGAPARRVPQAGDAHYAEPQAHAALDCDACHATWAPQCYGCHVSFDPDDSQWDHLARAVRPGAWHEHRWDIRNEPPPLGRAADGRIRPVIPGMIATIAHPQWSEPLSIRRFAVLSPHTSGAARPCGSCHGEPSTLGLGRGSLVVGEAGVAFEAAAPALRDGLPADAWTDLGGRRPPALPGDPRPLSPQRIERLLRPLSTPPP